LYFFNYNVEKSIFDLFILIFIEFTLDTHIAAVYVFGKLTARMKESEVFAHSLKGAIQLWYWNY
jgi:hypothetical protein